MEYLPVIAIIVSILGLLITYFGFIQKQNDRALAQNDRMTKLETKMDLFWKIVEHNVGQLLKAPTHIEKDTLLDKLARRELNLEETERLRTILTDEMQRKGRNNGVIAYVLILGRLEQILYDFKEKK